MRSLNINSARRSHLTWLKEKSTIMRERFNSFNVKLYPDLTFHPELHLLQDYSLFPLVLNNSGGLD